ncbi:hypothetical protein [Methanolobus profundi]|uniref:Uncharacterized protein n=1 Tax=Methanolobus profundi TaxID=487685 RepID=A0A1I4SAV3_9EURY|nr:hypothetical protein [Methanolobus profundi]SFM61434.1 hypothetical protein SAMN04488696_1865 [Methanolobus profundi]
MSDETTVTGADNTAPSTFERKELIEGVVQKHKKLLGEYNDEFGQLGNKLKELQESIDSSKRNREEVLEKLEILTEKRQLFYHQAEKTLDEIDSKVSSDMELSRQVSLIKEKLSKVKGSLSVDEEKAQVDSILQAITSLASKASGISDSLGTVKERINEALSSKIELSSIDCSEEDYNNTIASFDKEMAEIAPRHKWLENRLESHQEALKYWEAQPLVDDAEEVKA